LLSTAGWMDGNPTPVEAADQLAAGFVEFLQLAEMPISMTQAVGRPITEENLQGLAEEASQQWTGTFNPRKMDAAGFVELYRNALR